MVCLVAADVRAQDQPAPTPVTAGWSEGFFIQSGDGDYRLQFGVLLHADGRFALGEVPDSIAVRDMFLIRRARTSVRGRLARRFEFALNPDFAGGILVVQDAYLDTLFSPAFRIRVGKSKTPFGLERLQAVSAMLFFERGLPSAIVPNRDVGVQVMGELSGGVISYTAGVLNGVTDGASAAADTDTNDGKDLAGRVAVRPFARDRASSLRGLVLAVAGTWGTQGGTSALPTFRTADLQQPFFSYSGAAADGGRTRFSPQVSYYHKAFAALGEYVQSELRVRKGDVLADVDHDAWQVAASWVLTGEAATDASPGVRPRANFDFGAGHLGAFQIAARYHVLTVDEEAFALNLASAGSSEKAEAFTVGLNWYLTPNVRYVVNYERTVFDDGRDGARLPENALVFRMQLAL